jgi:hypothetical protein
MYWRSINLEHRILEEQNEIQRLYTIGSNNIYVQYIRSCHQHIKRSDKSAAADVFEIPYRGDSASALGNKKKGEAPGKGLAVFFGLGNTKYTFKHGEPSAGDKFGKGINGSYTDKFKSNICAAVFFDFVKRKGGS